MNHTYKCIGCNKEIDDNNLPEYDPEYECPYDCIVGNASICFECWLKDVPIDLEFIKKWHDPCMLEHLLKNVTQE